MMEKSPMQQAELLGGGSFTIPPEVEGALRKQQQMGLWNTYLFQVVQAQLSQPKAYELREGELEILVERCAAFADAMFAEWEKRFGSAQKKGGEAAPTPGP